MKFHIEKIHLWFSENEKRTLTFRNNMVNVIRGNSSRGKSNLLAIIDYCLMSDKPNIVQPVINDCTEFYGIEIVLNGEYISICRKKPVAGTGADSVFMTIGPFNDDFIPGITNKQISAARRLLDNKFNLKDNAYIYPFGMKDGVSLFTVSFRSFLMFNTLTENLIASEYEFLNYKFFEDSYVDTQKKRDYLMDVLLGIDNVLELQKKEMIESLKSKKRSTSILTTRYNKAKESYYKILQEVLSLCDAIEYGSKERINKVENKEDMFKCISTLIETYTPRPDKEVLQANETYRNLSNDLFKKKLQLANIVKAQKEYDEYLKSLKADSIRLRPVEFLKKHLDEYGGTIWSKKIIDELKRSLEKIIVKKNVEQPFVSEQILHNLRDEISELELKMKVQAQIKLKPIEQSSVYIALGQLKSILPNLIDSYRSIPPKPEECDYVHNEEIIKNAQKIVDEIEIRRSTVVNNELNKYFQEVYDSLTSMEYFQGCKTRYDRKHERLELSDGTSILNYSNIGSQSNFMFMHICFFLGLHKFLRNNPCDHIGQFLFIDQPSVPYYEHKDDNLSTDSTKLQDAFRTINSFMKEMVEEYKEDFQIILIEHADESYWTGDNNLEYFETRENFDGNNALIPYDVIERKRNENKNK